MKKYLITLLIILGIIFYIVDDFFTSIVIIFATIGVLEFAFYQYLVHGIKKKL